jgi:hypothetical protein
MKKVITLLATCSLLANAAFAQIQLTTNGTTDSYMQDFEGTFTTGSHLDFLPNWNGNQVQPTPGSPRIHRDTINVHSGIAALGTLPTSTVADTVVISFIAPVNAPTVSFWAASDSARSNPGGTRPAIVYHDYSIDGGATYINKMQLGDSTSFTRVPKPYQQFTITYPSYPMPAPASFKVRFIVSRGAGTGTAARFIMDDFMISCSNIVATINKQQLSQNMTIIPNPSNGNINLQITDADLQNATVSVYDALGKLTYQQANITINNGTLWALPTTLAAGIYTITAQTAAAIYTQKAVVR